MEMRIPPELMGKKPNPDFEMLERVLKGERNPKRVHFVEVTIDNEIIGSVIKKMTGKKLPSLEKIRNEKIERFAKGKEVVLLTSEREKIFWKHYINFYYCMGYDYAPILEPLLCLANMSFPNWRKTTDTAILSRKERSWAEEGKGVITSWADFENFHWERMKVEVDTFFTFLNQNLPEGMKVTVAGTLFEEVLERLLGYEGLFYLLYDQPDLVRAVFDKWGEVVYQLYKDVISRRYVGAILHHDDLGHKAGTMVSPDILRKLVFPWFKKYASLAHGYGKMYWYHCCGNVSEVMEDLIDDIEIDAFHSFQDVIIPVVEFKKRYGDRIATLGGVDMDKLCRLNGTDLKKYVRDILDKCMPSGRYALGSGNSIANYVPLENYLAMIEEAYRWGNRD